MKEEKLKILKRIQDLIEKGESIKTMRPVKKRTPFPHPRKINRGISYSPTVKIENVPHVEHSLFEEWRISSLSLIENASEPESIYKRSFEGKVRDADTGDVDKGIGILRALRNDIEQGYLTKYRTLVVAEVFNDFLEMAEYLLEGDFIHPAASLTGAVLEDGLRQLCKKNNIELRQNDNISSLNQKLGDKAIYNKIIQKQILAWKEIRNSADHGKFLEYSSDYKKEDVQEMLTGARRFLGEHLK